MGKKIQVGRRNPVRVLLTGYVGNNNLGDDLMMMKTIAFLQKTYPDIEITVLIRYQGKVKRQCYGSDIKIINLHWFRLGKIKETVYRYFIMPGYDLTLWVGGTCFADIGGNGLYSYFKHNISKKHAFGYVGIGIDYLEDSLKQKQAKELFENSSLTVFRDVVSARKLPELGLEAGKTSEDIAYLALDEIVNTKSKKNRLLVSWRYQSQYMDKQAEDRHIQVLLDTVEKIAQQYDEIVFLPIDEHMDGGVNRRLANCMQTKTDVTVRCIDHMDAYEKMKFISESKDYICGRLHGVLIGELAGCNVVSLNYSLKMDIFTEVINRQCDVVPVNQLSTEQIRSALAAGAMEEKERLQLFNEKKQSAELNYKYLAEVMDRIYEEKA